MSDPPGGLGGFPFGMDPESLRDAPLFREMQRVMASSSGPINWELARQVGVASAVEAGEDREPTDDERSGFTEAVRVAELHVARFTGLDAPTDVAEVRAIRRAEWVNANAESMQALLEPAAQRVSEAMMRAQGDSDARRDAGDERHAGADLSAADGRAGGFGPRFPRAAGAGPVRRGGAAIGAGRGAVRGAEHPTVRERLVARPDRLPHLGGVPRGDPPVRVRPAVGARPVLGAAGRLPVDAHDRRRGHAGEADDDGRRRSRGAAGAARGRRRRCSAPSSTTSSGSSWGGSSRSWRRPRATATM